MENMDQTKNRLVNLSNTAIPPPPSQPHFTPLSTKTQSNKKKSIDNQISDQLMQRFAMKGGEIGEGG